MRTKVVSALLVVAGTYGAMAQPTNKTNYDFYAQVGGESVAGSLIREAVEFANGWIQGSTVLVLEPGQFQPNAGVTSLWRESWVPASAKLNPLTGPAAQKHVDSCGSFLKVAFESAEPNRVTIALARGNRCNASGPSVAFDRTTNGWRLDPRSASTYAVSVTHCAC